MKQKTCWNPVPKIEILSLASKEIQKKKKKKKKSTFTCLSVEDSIDSLCAATSTSTCSAWFLNTALNVYIYCQN